MHNLKLEIPNPKLEMKNVGFGLRFGILDLYSIQNPETDIQTPNSGFCICIVDFEFANSVLECGIFNFRNNISKAKSNMNKLNELNPKLKIPKRTSKDIQEFGCWMIDCVFLIVGFIPRLKSQNDNLEVKMQNSKLGV